MGGQVKKLQVSEGTAVTNPTDLSFGSPIEVAIADATGPSSITGLSFDSATIKAAFLRYDVERRDDTQDATEMGFLYISYDNENAIWRITQESYLDTSGVTFTITSPGGQVQYTSSNYGGANYSGTFRCKIFSLDQ